ncbi:MAG TPA: hypothetical protein PLC76_01555 [Saprospiraceae bacterium]|nr:PQQ-like beta-propeller repeat protein [Candidatus Parvibacillus calidus]MBX2937813.1 PQQ-like beta-propeller repeat protein [Saprospiraceae bacterium]HNS13526.1 hypothetical protein [Bacteroidia bacterium]HQN93176.1 hypothetical protein [Prolixibacteraceae bacterium]MBX7179959.1 hypothetical protein [Saprospiraceae bacterium]
MGLLSWIFKACMSPPTEEKRFANDAKIDTFEVPIYHEKEVDYTYYKKYIDSTKILPFNYRDDAVFFMTMDDENLYVSMKPSVGLLKSAPEEAELRKPYLGLTAFDIKTRKMKWHLHYDDPAFTPFKVNDATIQLKVPTLIDGKLIQLKSSFGDPQLGCYSIIEPKTGKIIKTEEITNGGYIIYDLKYLLQVNHTNKVSRLSTEDGSVLWTYNYPLPQPADPNGLNLIGQKLFANRYLKDGLVNDDIIDAETGKVLYTTKIKETDLGKTKLNLVACTDDKAYFSAVVHWGMDRKMASKQVRYNIEYDIANQKVLRRSEYDVEK